MSGEWGMRYPSTQLSPKCVQVVEGLGHRAKKVGRLWLG